jgi:hypothetical protein
VIAKGGAVAFEVSDLIFQLTDMICSAFYMSVEVMTVLGE